MSIPARVAPEPPLRLNRQRSTRRRSGCACTGCAAPLRDGESGGETSDVWAPLAANSNHPDLSLPLSTSSCTGCTDHVCFWREGIPFLGFFTGLHDEYHTLADDVDTINFPGMVQVGSVAMRALSRLMVMETPPPLTGQYPTGQ